jgi:hypothetical protein
VIISIPFGLKLNPAGTKSLCHQYRARAACSDFHLEVSLKLINELIIPNFMLDKVI